MCSINKASITKRILPSGTQQRGVLVPGTLLQSWVTSLADFSGHMRLGNAQALSHILRHQMINECEHHAFCARTRTATFTQRTLINKSGLLSLSARPPPLHRRTPVPHAIRRIANTPTFAAWVARGEYQSPRHLRRRVGGVSGSDERQAWAI
jgi:hypothetical protein